MKPIFIGLAAFALIAALSAGSCKQMTEPSGPGTSLDSLPTITQGVYGKVLFWKGDFMPIVTEGTISPVQRMIVVHALTKLESTDQIVPTPFFRAVYTARIDSTSSNAVGFYQIQLPPGRFSFFIREGTLYYCNGFDGEGYLSPVTVAPDSITEVNFNITYEAAF